MAHSAMVVRIPILLPLLIRCRCRGYVGCELPYIHAACTGVSQTRGWAWLPSGLGNLGGPDEEGDVLCVGSGYGGHVLGGRLYGRALRNSEVIGNFRAGLPQPDNGAT